MRITWGWAFFQTGWGKLTNHAQVAEFFASLNIPAPALNAWVAGTIECFGGLFLLLGLASRLATIPLIVTMIVAYIAADPEAIFGIFQNLDKFTSAEPFLFLLTAVIVLIFGPGAFSLDHLIERKILPPNASAERDSFALHQTEIPAGQKSEQIRNQQTQQQ